MMNPFDTELQHRIIYVNMVLKRYLTHDDSPAAAVLDAMQYSVMAGGKRIRPIILHEVYQMCGGGEPAVVEPFLAALECIHTYSLVHDDLPAMDNDRYRRGQLTTHAKFGEAMGVLAGDALLNYAYELLTDTIARAAQNMTLPEHSGDIAGICKAAQYIAQKAGVKGMVGGQVVDVELTGKPMSAAQLDYIFRLKTGALLEAAFTAGALLAGAEEATVKDLERAGLLIGIAFQIQDDILDVIGTQDELGKPVFSDEKNHKITYVTLYGLDRAQADVKQYSLEAVEIIQKHNGTEFLIQLVNYLISRRK